MKNLAQFMTKARGEIYDPFILYRSYVPKIVKFTKRSIHPQMTNAFSSKQVSLEKFLNE